MAVTRRVRDVTGSLERLIGAGPGFGLNVEATVATDFTT
jgi:hypothetical protein